jgi:arylsulfatase A-like enzyme
MARMWLRPPQPNRTSSSSSPTISAPAVPVATARPPLTDKAVAWIGQQKRDKPFFLHFTPVAVHEPVTPSVHTKGTSKAGPHGDWIHELDRSVGRILDTLDKQQITGEPKPNHNSTTFTKDLPKNAT